MFGRPKEIVNIVIEDYVIRLIENVGADLKTLKVIKEKALPPGIIVGGKVSDEIKFFEFMKELVKECGIRNRRVRFYVPNSLVIMRQVEFPADLPKKEVKEYIYSEMGKSIHLPFKTPVIDVHYNEQDRESNDEEGMRQGTIFAAPEEELIKYTEIFVDTSLRPIAVDVQALGIYRYMNHQLNIQNEKIYLVVELNVNSFNLSIFKGHELEFLRYQNLDLEIQNWEYINEKNEDIQWKYKEDNQTVYGVVEDQIIELERIMNFYQFSLKKDGSKVNELVLLGDHPMVSPFYEKVSQQFDIPSNLLKGITSNETEVGPKYTPALGLALKGGKTNAS